VVHDVHDVVLAHLRVHREAEDLTGEAFAYGARTCRKAQLHSVRLVEVQRCGIVHRGLDAVLPEVRAQRLPLGHPHLVPHVRVLRVRALDGKPHRQPGGGDQVAVLVGQAPPRPDPPGRCRSWTLAIADTISDRR
jgi:hypothetical protein